MRRIRRPYSWQRDVFDSWELWRSIMRAKHLEAERMQGIGIPLTAQQVASLLKLGEDKPASISPDVAIVRLRDHFVDWAKEHEFKPGDIVKLKPGMKVHQFPEYEQPCIVMEVLDPPMIGSDRHTQEHGAKLNVRLGVIHAKDSEFVFCAFEGRTLMPWEPAT